MNQTHRYLTPSPLPCFADLALASLQAMATQRQWKSLAEGTWLNHRSAVKTFLAFCSHLNLSPRKIHHSLMCVYIEYLALHIKAPGTIVNNISHVRVFMALAGYQSTQVDHPRVSRALDAIKRNKAYVPKTKQPVPMGILRQVLISLDPTPQHTLVRAALLIQFYGAMRKSEVSPPSVRKFSAISHLTRGDASFSKDSISLHIKAAKNLQYSGQSKKVTLHAAPDKNLYVVTAVRAAMAPTSSPSDPLLMFPQRNVMPVTFVQKVWAEKLVQMGLPANMYTLHGLRSAAATQAYTQGASELDIQKFGGWRSAAHKLYIRSNNNAKVNKALIRSLKAN